MNTENQQPGQMRPSENHTEQNKETLELTNEIKSQLTKAGGWAKFLAILGFIVMGMTLLGGLIISIVLAVVPKSGLAVFPFPPFLIGLLCIILAGVYFFPILYLYRFATGVKKALYLKDQNWFTRAFTNLKALYRFIGILMIVMLVLYPILIAVMVFAQVFHVMPNFVGMHT